MRKALLATILILALPAAWLLGVRSWYRSVQPAGPTLRDHLAARPAPQQRRVVVASGQEHLVLFGPIQMFPRLPSGYPVYVFSSAGQLVDWTPDEGDDEAFKQRWPGLFSGREVTPAQVAAWPGATPEA